jgi:hypothetical protein
MKKTLIIAIFILTNIIAMNACFDSHENSSDNDENAMRLSEQLTSEYDGANIHTGADSLYNSGGKNIHHGGKNIH